MKAETSLSELLRMMGRDDATVQSSLERLAQEIRFYNRRVNLVSRQDEIHLLSRHIPHCLALAQQSFGMGHTVIDWGTGGGLPLLPLAIVFPDAAFVGVDRIGKKLQAVQQMARSLGLANVSVWQGEAERCPIPHTHSVSRATAPLGTLWQWHRHHSLEIAANPGEHPAGLVCLKGGDLQGETASPDLEGAVVSSEEIKLADAYFRDKYVVRVQKRHERTEDTCLSPAIFPA